MCGLVLATMLYVVTGVFFESAPIWVRALVGLFGVMLGGGGIAASTSFLALKLLGYPSVALYDGSLLDWSTDPDLPLIVD